MKLPIAPTIVDAYRIFFANLGAFARLAWFPVIAQFAAAVFARNYVPGLAPETSEKLWLLGMSLEILVLFLGIPATTAWYRLVALGREDRCARIRYSVRATELQYLWRYLVFLVVVLSVGFCIVLAASEICTATASCEEFESSVLAGPFLLMPFVVVALSFVRFMLVLPAAATGRRMRFGDSWRLTKGNGYRLGALLFLAGAPFYIFPEVLEIVYFGGFPEDELINPMSYLVLEAIVYWFFFTIDVSVLALVFKKFDLEVSPG